MKRDYDDGVKDNVVFFTGKEVEKTPTHGKETLFVVGVHSSKKIKAMAKKNNATHIYLGANHSMKHLGGEYYESLQRIIKVLLEDYYVTLDTPISPKIPGIDDLLKHKKFTVVYALPIENIMQMKGNVVIKLDDSDYKATNPGVWCWSVRDMMTEQHFTDWAEYGKDKII
jgi:hypothetical protein